MLFITRKQPVVLMAGLVGYLFIYLCLAGVVCADFASPYLTLNLNLPVGKVASADMTYDININIEGNNTAYSTTISSNQNGTTVFIAMADLKGQDAWLTVRKQWGSDTPPYLSTFYYSSTETGHASWEQCPLSTFSTDSNQVITMVVPVGKVIEGTVSLPSGENNEQYVGFEINATLSGAAYYYINTSIYFNAPDTSATYSMVVPDAPGSTVQVGFSTWGNLASSPTQSYLPKGYYSKTGTVFESYDATLIESKDQTGIDMTLLKGTRVFGTVSLPDNKMATGWGNSFHLEMFPVGGIAWWDNYSGYVTMHSGENSVPFAISVPSDTSKDYSLSYVAYFSDDCKTNTLFEGGVYTNSGTTWNRDLATLFNVGTTDVTGKNMTVLEGNRITGTVAYPTGMKNEEGYTVMGTVEIVSPDFSWLRASKDLYFEADESSAEFCFIAPDDTGLKGYLGFTAVPPELLASTDVVVPGYYSSSGPTATYSQLTPIAGGTNHSNLELTMLKGSHAAIKGSVALPDGEVAPVGGAFFGVQACMNTPFTVCYSVPALATVTIEEGENSVPLSIPVKTTDTSVRWVVVANHYNYWIPCSPYVQSYAYTTYYESTCWEDKARSVLYSENVPLVILKECDLQKQRFSINSMMAPINAAVKGKM